MLIVFDTIKYSLTLTMKAMYKFIRFLLFIVIQKKMILSEKYNWLDNIVDQIIFDSTLSQVTIFTTECNRSNILQQKVIIKKIIQQVPSTTIDSTLIFSSRNDNLRIHGNPQKSVLYIILESKNQFFHKHHTRQLLNFLIKLAPIISRPKCLIILLNEYKFDLDEKVNDILLSAWELKFLDFSIISVNSSNEPIIFHYNPYTKVFYKNKIQSFQDIFPNKIVNMNGYPFNIAIYNSTPVMTVFFNKKNNKTVIKSFDNSFLKIFSEKFNFSSKFKVQRLPMYHAMFFPFIYAKLRSGEINMIGSQILVGSNLYNNNVTIGKLSRQGNFLLIAPNLPIQKIHLSMDVYYYLFLFSSFILIFAITVKLMKFPKKQWGFFQIFQILMGISLRKLPKKLSQKIIFASLLLLSMKYSSDAFTKLTDVEVTYGSQSFDKPEDIIKSNFPVYSPEFVRNETYDDPSEIISKLKSRIQLLSYINCTEKIVETKNCFCIAPQPMARQLVAESKSKNKRPMMKLTKAEFWFDYLAFAYETASPYVDKFDQVLQRIVENGLADVMDAPGMNYKFHDSTRTETILIPQLLTILIVGYFFSILLFMYETSICNKLAKK